MLLLFFSFYLIFTYPPYPALYGKTGKSFNRSFNFYLLEPFYFLPPVLLPELPDLLLLLPEVDLDELPLDEDLTVPEDREPDEEDLYEDPRLVELLLDVLFILEGDE
jgi:hypothetical protein